MTPQAIVVRIDALSRAGTCDPALGVVTDGLVQCEGLLDALEFVRASLDDPEPGRLDVMQNVFPEEHLIRPCLRRDSCRDVDRAAEIVALLVDHRPSVHTNVG